MQKLFVLSTCGSCNCLQTCNFVARRGSVDALMRASGVDRGRRPHDHLIGYPLWGSIEVWALSLKCTSRAGGGWDACGVHGLGLVLRAPGAVETPPGGAVPGVLQGPGPGHRGAVQRGGHSGEPFFPQTSPWKPAFLVSLPWLLLLLLLLGAAYYTQREHSAQMRELLLRALHAGLRSGTYRQRRRL
ncbi:uncharacterized protein LOC119252288 isoform X6 [Talpa occidentalis]|uniref:uncharacterized protein LOC119252288 isoform X6 n=1 Tax=Talpa occidentalis TaxID=50954 RepID=UPI0023F9EA3C|nr:uncharacterized protein LOC119252288 isoform X6 [Talpa occidentalis]